MRFACIINVWLWTQLKFIFLWLPRLSEGLQITGKELGDTCSHLVSGGPSESCQEACHLSKQANAWQRKKDSVFGMETAGHGGRGEGGLSPTERSLGDSELTQRPEEMLGRHTGKQVKAGEEFLNLTHTTPVSWPWLYPREFSVSPGKRGQWEIRPDSSTLSVLIREV